MKNFEKDYYDIHRYVEETEKSLSKIEKDKKVQLYINLKHRYENLLNLENKLYKKMKYEEYSKCNHILVYSKENKDEKTSTLYTYCGCIKCGLTDLVLSRKYVNKGLSGKEKVMHDYLADNHIIYLLGKQLPVSCDLSLAQSIYKRIKEAKPDLDDDTICEYFERALAHIRNNKVNEYRKNNRAKRLSLDPDFNKWNSDDISN